MPDRKLITREHFEERIAIKLEPFAKVSKKQWHYAREECLEEFRELYGDFEIVRWPRESHEIDR